MAAKLFFMEIVTPEESFYSGEVESITIKTSEGYEGFLANHCWCCKLLAEEGEIRFRTEGNREEVIITLKGGYIDVGGSVMVYADKAEWKDERQRKHYAEIK